MKRLIGAEVIKKRGVFGRQGLTNGSIEFVHAIPRSAIRFRWDPADGPFSRL